ncbi:MAG: lysophospholipase [Coriobacteriia bacterium]|nr:lysophospholipase [Coriobacteriia bacterium]MCL2751103.1 lysophospholipase [Coriobacteriia bacterium]
MTEEKIVVGAGTEFPLNGILTLPDTAEQPLPAVVLVHGSGPQTMDEKIGKVTPFKDIAQALAEKGIATLRYDKRTKIYGRKMMKNAADITVKTETIDDTILATELLRGDSRIGKIFILGHSMGGMLAPRIDAEGGNYDGIIIAAGSPRELREILMDQFADALEGYKGLIKLIASKQIASIIPKLVEIDSLTDEEAKKKKVLGGSRAYYFKEFEAYPTSPYLDALDKPLFVFQGSEDFQVNPHKDFEGYKRLLEGKPNATLKLYPGLNHVFTTQHATRSMKDYKVPEKVAPEVTNDIADWIWSV